VMQWRKTALSARKESPNKIIALIFSLTFLVIYLKFHDFKGNRLFTDECVIPLPMGDLENHSFEATNVMTIETLLFFVPLMLHLPPISSPNAYPPPTSSFLPRLMLYPTKVQ
jgi:hypothetical protein